MKQFDQYNVLAETTDNDGQLYQIAEGGIYNPDCIVLIRHYGNNGDYDEIPILKTGLCVLEMLQKFIHE